MPVLYGRQLPVDVRLPRIRLNHRQLSIKKGGVGFVLEVVEPGVWGSRRG
jgi:hypothetical protein